MLELATECSNRRWNALKSMTVGLSTMECSQICDDWVTFRLLATVAYQRRLAYQLWAFGALCDDEDGRGVPLVFRILGVK